MSEEYPEYDTNTVLYMMIGVLQFLKDQKMNQIPAEYFNRNYSSHTAAVSFDEYNNVYSFNLINDEEFGNAT
jgi:hypothetical protein